MEKEKRNEGKTARPTFDIEKSRQRRAEILRLMEEEIESYRPLSEMVDVGNPDAFPPNSQWKYGADFLEGRDLYQIVCLADAMASYHFWAPIYIRELCLDSEREAYIASVKVWCKIQELRNWLFEVVEDRIEEKERKENKRKKKKARKGAVNRHWGWRLTKQGGLFKMTKDMMDEVKETEERTWVEE